MTLIDKKAHKLAARLQQISHCRLPQARIIRNWHEHLLLKRESQAEAQRAIKAPLKIIADNGTLTPTEREHLDRAEALIASATQSRRDYESDIIKGTTRPHPVIAGHPRAITGRGHFAVLKHNHADPQYMQVYDSSGIYSHSVPLKGPCRVDQLAANLRPSRLPAPDSLASTTLAVIAACRRHDVIMDQAIQRADRLASRSHRKSKKRGTRRRGSGKGQIETNKDK